MNASRWGASPSWQSLVRNLGKEEQLYRDQNITGASFAKIFTRDIRDPQQVLLSLALHLYWTAPRAGV